MILLYTENVDLDKVLKIFFFLNKFVLQHFSLSSYLSIN